MLSSYFLFLGTLTVVWGAGANDGQQGGYRDLVCAEERTVILEVQAGLRRPYVRLNWSKGLRERAGKGISTRRRLSVHQEGIYYKWASVKMIPFPVVHSILIRRECISCIF